VYTNWFTELLSQTARSSCYQRAAQSCQRDATDPYRSDGSPGGCGGAGMNEDIQVPLEPQSVLVEQYGSQCVDASEQMDAGLLIDWVVKQELLDHCLILVEYLFQQNQVDIVGVSLITRALV